MILPIFIFFINAKKRQIYLPTSLSEYDFVQIVDKWHFLLITCSAKNYANIVQNLLMAKYMAQF